MAAAAAFSACMLWSVSGYAQLNAVAHSVARAAVTSPASVVNTSAIRVYVAPTSEPSAPAVVPSNLKVSAHLTPILESMLQRSPSFRRQCQRIAAAPSVTVAIGLFHPLASDHRRALTTFERRSGELFADVRIATLEDKVELIAHEIEHVIEQLDGVDLPSQATLRGAAASLGTDGAFETVRAIRKGLAVAREVESVR